MLKELKNSVRGGFIKSFKPGSQPSTPQIGNKIKKQAAGLPPKVGIDNITTGGFAGPLAFDIGFGRDPKALKPDLTARMEFKEFD